MIKEVLDELGERMQKSVESLQDDLLGIRTGRASPALVERLAVEYYGTATPLNQMATLAIPESRLITIQPWDVSVIKDIEKAILKSDLGLTPSNDGKIIRIAIPPLTEERRKDLVKTIKTMAEETRVRIRAARRHAMDAAKKMQKDGGLTEDDLKSAEIQIQKLTDKYCDQIDKIVEAKQAEIMEL